MITQGRVLRFINTFGIVMSIIVIYQNYSSSNYPGIMLGALLVGMNAKCLAENWNKK